VRARCLILAMVLMVAAAVLSGCLSEQKIKIQNELSKLTDRFIEHREAAEVAELEAMFADRLLLHTGVGMLDLLGEFMEELKIFWLEEWLPNPSEQDPERELWAGHLLQEMLARYGEDPTDPAIEELAAAAAERVTLGYYFSDLTEAEPEVVDEWLDQCSFSKAGITIPQGVLVEWFSVFLQYGITYEITGRSAPFEDDGKWYVWLDAVQTNPWGTGGREFILGFSRTGDQWLIDFFRIVYD